jgi:4-aminobutyrate aminotransferase/4-aminobutyrate aminotransferase/(S)-3-amino-2-methylpropionate transaminase
MPETALLSGAAEDLLGLKARHLVPCVYHFYQRPPVIVRGEGCYLYDDTGRAYLDCYSGVTVMSAGHCNPAIIEPAIEQLRTLQHTTSIYLTEPVLRLAERLASIAPGDLSRSFFTASGSEAVEGALLACALHTGRNRVIAMHNGLHGRTRWAMNVTGAPMWRTDPFPQDGVTHLPFGDIEALAALLAEEGDTFAAIIAEPIQGNGGVNVPAPGYWPAVRRLCDGHGILLVFDEVQTGLNRTGRWFACEHWHVVPDAMAISKALGNGFPIAAFIVTDRVAASYTRPGASTYGGNPVSAAAALATLDFHESRGLGAAAGVMGAMVRDALESVASRYTCLGRTRGMGLMLGVPVVDGNGEADAARCDRLLEGLKDNGVLVGKTGPQRNVLTFMPPLTIRPEDVGLLIEALEKAVTDDAC